MIFRHADASWDGSLEGGQGTVTLGSGALHAAYSAQTRFGSEPGTNPEELVAAAHASCFSMTLTFELAKHKLYPRGIQTSAGVSLVKEGEDWKISESRLEVFARVPGASEAAFQAAVERARKNCPISKLFNTEISVVARLAEDASYPSPPPG